MPLRVVSYTNKKMTILELALKYVSSFWKHSNYHYMQDQKSNVPMIERKDSEDGHLKSHDSHFIPSLTNIYTAPTIHQALS